MIGSSFSLLTLPWWPQNNNSPDSNFTITYACAPQMSQRSAGERVVVSVMPQG